MRLVKSTLVLMLVRGLVLVGLARTTTIEISFFGQFLAFKTMAFFQS